MCQPWLSKANKTDFGHTLVDSKATPGVIVDTLALSQETIDAHPEAAKAIVAGWYDALAFMKEHPDEAMEIMAKHLGEKPEAIKDEMKGEVTLNDNGTERKMHPGDFAICYDGESHGIANRTDKPASLFAAIIKTK